MWMGKVLTLDTCISNTIILPYVSQEMALMYLQSTVSPAFTPTSVIRKMANDKAAEEKEKLITCTVENGLGKLHSYTFNSLLSNIYPGLVLPISIARAGLLGVKGMVIIVSGCIHVCSPCGHKLN